MINKMNGIGKRWGTSGTKIVHTKRVKKIRGMSNIDFSTLLKETVPLDSLPIHPLHINNIVSSVQLLQPGQSLCLESLSLQLNGMVKYEPKTFAAAVIRIKDSIGSTTCLAFQSGNLVVVGALTEYHSIMACHIYRQLIERVVSVYRDEQGELCLHNLVGRTQFNNWNISNIVANDELLCQPDLTYLRQIAPEIANYNAELFPGLRLLVWIKPKHLCQCERKKKNSSCSCNCRALIFDSKQIVITGCKNIQSLNTARQLIHAMFTDTMLHHQTKEISSSSSSSTNTIIRFKERRAKILKAASIEFDGILSVNDPSPPPPPPPVIQIISSHTNMSLDSLMKSLKKQYTRKTSSTDKNRDSDMEPLVKACKYNQFDNVKTISSFESQEVIEMARQYCKEHELEVDKQILEHLFY